MTFGMLVFSLLCAWCGYLATSMWRSPRRLYRSGTRWGLRLWTMVDSEYITRLHLVKTPWFAVCLHWINKPDPEPYLHDHPVTFLSLILRGGYEEKRKRGAAPWDYEYHRWWNFIRATPQDRHTISHVRPGTLTLCLMGPKVREWGFHAPDRWIYWKEYYATKRAEQAREALKSPGTTYVKTSAEATR